MTAATEDYNKKISKTKFLSVSEARDFGSRLNKIFQARKSYYLRGLKSCYNNNVKGY